MPENKDFFCSNLNFHLTPTLTGRDSAHASELSLFYISYKNEDLKIRELHIFRSIKLIRMAYVDCRKFLDRPIQHKDCHLRNLALSVDNRRHKSLNSRSRLTSFPTDL